MHSSWVVSEAYKQLSGIIFGSFSLLFSPQYFQFPDILVSVYQVKILGFSYPVHLGYVSIWANHLENREREKQNNGAPRLLIAELGSSQF
jgi:hypothetical protein